MSVLALLFLLHLALSATQSPIQNVVVLMLENHSFDHMCGYMEALNPEIDGVDGTQYNFINASNPNSQKIYVTSNGSYIPAFDPDHSVPGTTKEIFGGSVANQNPAPMSGFVQHAADLGQNPPSEVMSCFNPSTVPVITTLAEEFAVFDKWYPSIPGPTLINRLYLHSATSYGVASDDGDIPEILLGYPQKTIYESLQDAGLTWGVYQEEITMALAFKWTRKPENLHCQHWFEDFQDHINLGKLPNYSFLAPRFAGVPGLPANDEHPSHDVALGELLIKHVYDTLRNSSYWNQTLFIVTYDEHGGFFDHVPTPQNGVPNPDGRNSTNPPFNFNRLGVRIPTIMASPWINKGTVVHEPTGPTSTSQFEHSSIAATLKTMFNLPDFLTKRDAWAGTFESVFSERTTPRTDCPPTMPSPPSTHKVRDTHKLPLNDLQRGLVRLASSLHGSLYAGDTLPDEQSASEYIQYTMEKLLGRTRASRY